MASWRNYSNGRDSSDYEPFRENPAIPSVEEFLTQSRYGIPENRVSKPYSSACQYLETQFRLLREDLLYPYRTAVYRFRNREIGQDSDSPSSSSSANLNREIQVYNRVKLVEIRPGINGVEFGMEFEVAEEASSSPIDWENSQLLMNNALLCISSDDFQTFTFAVVSSRKSSELKKNRLGIRPVEGYPLEIHNATDYTMFESRSSYLEAYIHALKVLQRPDMEHLYFIDNLVHLEPTVKRMNLGFQWKKQCKFVEWLDETQIEAVDHALNKSLAVIQGPPGTGKTFVGTCIVQAFLKKENHRGPILVVCYTNRALDQFLEGLCQFEKSLVRMGSRSQSAALQSFCWSQVVGLNHGVSLPKHVRSEYFRRNRDKKSLACKIRYKYKHFKDKNMCREELRDLAQKYLDVCMRAQEARINKDKHELSGFKVVGMTATFAARNHELLCRLGSEIMVVEEAAEITEAQLLGCLNPCIKRLILIGDHMQLRPLVASNFLAKSHNLDISMFERMVSQGVEYRALGFQRRMRPQISSLVSGFYTDLKDHESVEGFPSVNNVKADVLFIDHNNPETPSYDPTSRWNPVEAEMVVRFYRNLVNHCGYMPKDIAIVSMYRSQVERITELINGRRVVPPRLRKDTKGKKAFYRCRQVFDDLELKGCVVKTVDEFQGGESNIILLSLVRNIESSQSIGFLDSVNRICVALSRARWGLYIFGSAELLINNSWQWKEIINRLQSNDLFRKVESLDKVNDLFNNL